MKYYSINNSIKKIISLFISIFILFTLIPNQLAIDVKAYKGYDYTDDMTMAKKLDEVFSGSCGLYLNGKSAFFPVGSRLNNSTMYHIGSSNGPGGWQCFAYAQGVYYYLFGEIPGNGSKSYTKSEKAISNVGSISYELFKNNGISTGAYIRTTTNKDGSYNSNAGHSMIVLNYNESELTILEGNGDGKGLVRTRTKTWGQFNSGDLSNKRRRICHIINPISGIPPQPTVIWNSINADYRVTVSNLNIRNGYTTSSPSIGKLNNENIVYVIETADCLDGRTWAKITFNGQTGYCCMRDGGKTYLTKDLTPDKPTVSVTSGTSFSNTVIYWNMCNLAAYYEVKVDGISYGTTNNTSYSIPLHTGGHNTEVIAYSSNGSSNPSGVINFKVAKTYPEKASVTASPGNSKSTTYISWNNCQYADSYNITIYNSLGTAVATKNNTTDLNYDTKLPAGNYYVIVKSHNNTDNTDTQSDRKNFSVEVAIPSTPTLNVLSGNNYTDTYFTWNICEYADNYKLEVTNKDTNKQVLNKTINSTSYNQIFSTAGNYTAKVYSVNAQDNVSTSSQTFDFYVESADCTEFDLSVAGRSDSVIVLDWTVSEHATQYDVYRYDGGKYVLIGTTEDTTFTDAGLYIDTTYRYYVKASNQWTKMDSNEVETETIILTLNGSGSEADPYLVGSVEDLETVRNLVNDSTTTKVFGNACYQLINDIDLSGVNWTSVGTEKCVFNGTFNGNYYTISGLSGSIFGYCDNAIIENIVVYGDISSSGTNVGGIAGRIGNGKIENCAFYGNVSGTDNVGGIVGYMQNGGSLVRCYHIGKVSGKNAVGGIAGQINKSSLSYCYHAGETVSGTGKIGGIAGHQTGISSYTDCYYLKNNCSYGVSNGTNAGVVAVNDTVLKNLTSTLGKPFTVNPDSTVNNGYPVFSWEVVQHEFEGDGTSSSPYQIGTAEDLQYLSLFVNDTYLNAKYENAYYIQTADIDLSGIMWMPIGTESTPFNGNYNGGYRNITGLSNYSKLSYGGLFGYCGDVSVKNLIVYGDISAKDSAGGIIAKTNSSCNLDEVAFIGSVNGTDAGGLVGKINIKGTINQSYHNGTVKGTNAGGLVGQVVYDSNITTETCFIKNSYHTNGSISGTKTGGIVGTGNGIELENCFYLKNSMGSTLSGVAANETVMKALAETIESPFTDNSNTSLNNGYPVFTWQISRYEFDGTGTKNDPYLIGSSDDLIALQEYINNPAYHSTYANAYYEQINDIDLGDMQWTAIGMSEEIAFNGVYNGNGFTVYGLNACGETYSGLFGQVGATSNGRNAGIYNIIIEYGTSSSSTGVVGGIAAVLMNSATADSCAVIGDLYGDSGVGGVVGIVRKSGTITNSYHNGDVSGNSRVGGILGYAESGTARIENCYHTVGEVNGNEHIGAITGSVGGAVKINNCYYLTGTCSGAVNGKSNEGVSVTSEKVMKALAPTLGEAYMDNIYEMYFNDGYPILLAQNAPDGQIDIQLGDVNDDGVFNVSDAVLFQKWILAIPNVKLANWKAADFCDDDRLDVFDLCLMKKALVEQSN